ncbi:MAG TPA: hypothetical protein VHG69_13440 [Thermoleophilaceae bacterium]|nr:hypothetical protein [Thermoleophilaceae bacterium]
MVWSVLYIRDQAVGEGTCFPRQPAMKQGFSSSEAPRWTLRPQRRRIGIALDNYVGQPKEGRGYAKVRRGTPARRRGGRRSRGGGGRALPRRIRLAAFLLGGLSDGSRDIGARAAARAKRTPDGMAINVTVCVRRSERRELSRPGRYTGRVRVAGPRVGPADIPVAVTIKAALPEYAVLALVIAALGSALGAAYSRPAGGDDTAEEIRQRRQLDASDPEQAKKENRRRAFSALPFLSGLVAGVIAAWVVYADDPTFGASRGADTAKLIAAAFAGATTGLTVATPPARALQKRV